MSEAAVETVNVDRRDGTIHVAGALVIANATHALDAAAGVFDEGEEKLVFDLAGLARCDSAALAVLLEWRRRASRRGRSLVYRNAPERLRQLARISDLEAVLGIDA